MPNRSAVLSEKQTFSLECPLTNMHYMGNHDHMSEDIILQTIFISVSQNNGPSQHNNASNSKGAGNGTAQGGHNIAQAQAARATPVPYTSLFYSPNKQLATTRANINTSISPKVIYNNGIVAARSFSPHLSGTAAASSADHVVDTAGRSIPQMGTSSTYGGGKNRSGFKAVTEQLQSSYRPVTNQLQTSYKSVTDQ